MQADDAPEKLRGVFEPCGAPLQVVHPNQDMGEASVWKLVLISSMRASAQALGVARHVGCIKPPWLPPCLSHGA